MDLHISDLYSFDHSFHKPLFLENPLWNPLIQLLSYLQSFPLGKIEGTISSQAILINPHLIFIGENSLVEGGAYIEGPCYIGKECVIRHGAYIRGGALIGDRAVVGHSTEIKHSILLEDAKAPHFNYVGDSIIGQRSNLGAGAITANLRLDKGLVRVSGLETPLRKLGVLMGDDVQVGCNVVMNPGTVIRKNTIIPPCQAIKGVI
ncbi:MAG: UDP-N-acetylglucosamine diphosphorylase [Simkaniaceae bacterium]|nr:UDP-N-acetylglucosamine diphosphorylase [Simkaniaceae bacterium]